MFCRKSPHCLDLGRSHRDLQQLQCSRQIHAHRDEIGSIVNQRLDYIEVIAVNPIHPGPFPLVVKNLVQDYAGAAEDRADADKASHIRHGNTEHFGVPQAHIHGLE